MLKTRVERWSSGSRRPAPASCICVTFTIPVIINHNCMPWHPHLQSPQTISISAVSLLQRNCPEITGIWDAGSVKLRCDASCTSLHSDAAFQTKANYKRGNISRIKLQPDQSYRDPIWEFAQNRWLQNETMAKIHSPCARWPNFLWGYWILAIHAKIILPM